MQQNSSKNLGPARNPSYNYFAIQLTVAIFKIVGLAPLWIEKGPSKVSPSERNPPFLNSVKFVQSRLGWIYNSLLVLVSFTISFITVRRLYDHDYPAKSQLTTRIEVIQAVIGIAMIIFLWSTMAVKQRTMVNLLNRLVVFHSTISRDYDSKVIGSSRSFVIGIFIVNTIIWLLNFTSDLQAYAIVVEDTLNDIVPAVIGNWLIVQYSLLVKIVQLEYRCINRSLGEETSDCSIVEDLRSRDNDLPIVYGRSTKIGKLRRAHAKLCEIANDISEFYSLPILITIALNSFSIVYNSYTLVLPFVFHINDDSGFMTLSSSGWIFGLALPIAVLTKNVDDASAEIKKTADIVHEIFDRSNISRQGRTDLKQFAIELLQRKLHFTAYGLFPLDRTLVQSIFSMVVTYLIILYQFQLSGLRTDLENPARNITTQQL